MQNHKKIIEALSWAKDLFIVWLVSFLFVTFIAQSARVDGSSMADTLHNEELVMVDKLTPMFTSYERGDIVVVWCDEYQEFLIKRVVALPGETISMSNDGTVYINGEEYFEAYAAHKDGEGRFLGCFEDGEVTVPEDSYFLMGDNREFSSDSRMLGTFSKKEIKGRAFWRFYPFAKMTKLC